MVYKGRLKKSQTWDIVPNSVPTPSEDRVSLRGNFLAGFLRLVKDAFRIKKNILWDIVPKLSDAIWDIQNFLPYIQKTQMQEYTPLFIMKFM